MRNPCPSPSSPAQRAGCAILLMLCSLFPALVWANCAAPLANIVSVQGSVEQRAGADANWNRTRLHDALCPGDSLRTGANSRAALVLNDSTLMRLDQNTAVTFPEQPAETSAWAMLQTGIAHFIARVRQSFEVVTPFMNAGIEGTEFTVAVNDDSAQVTVFEGRVRAHNSLGQLVLAPGQSAEARAGAAPVLKVWVRPRDAVQWALYYPAILGDIDSAAVAELPASLQAALQRSLAAYRQSDSTTALAELTGLPLDLQTFPATSSPGPTADYSAVYTFRAALYLGVGRVSEAQADLARALKSKPVKSADNAQALALQAIIAVVQNDKNTALQLAQQALAADPNESAAALALSYARQAHFDISGALDAVNLALTHHADDALNWSRLAELQLSSADLPAALDSAQRATNINPELARTQSVLGFSWLARFDSSAAQTAFQRAIELDQADPLPRLGLGLANIRAGRLAHGRREIEIAASLDPDSSLIRSYLGKAYYEEKRDQLAATELDSAKQLDPFDPTPWFYDAIRKQTENQPVAALQDLQQSIDLNDNRAVYRSKLLLDSDLAARSASLGRLYGDLGFERLGLLEGYKSLAQDPADYSAHRLLADNYAALPRHEIARVSELLQSQLLQPLGLNPLQPQLAESNLAILEGAGPSSLSFSEFNPLFTRNRTALLANAILGSNGIRGDDLVVSGLHERFSYSLGQFHYQSDGFRDNNDQQRDLYNAFFQFAFTPDTSIQLEYRDSQSETGDLAQRFDPAFSTTLRETQAAQTLRLGLHHRWSPNSELLGSVIYRSQQSNAQDAGGFPATEFDDQSDGYIGELQHQYRSEKFSLISGLGVFSADTRQENSFDFSPLECLIIDLPPSCTDLQNSTIRHDNAYLYSQVHLTNRANLTLGLSADAVESALAGNTQLNPKFGLVWNLSDSSTLRGAWFRALKRDLIANQTLEPTQVAGFNQFFDEDTGTDSTRYGIALDQKFPDQDLFGGVEFSHRDLDSPFLDIRREQASVNNARLTQDLHRAYLYWTPRSWLAASVGYEYERFALPEELSNSFLDLRTQRIPLGIRLFFSSGFSAGLKATYVEQKITRFDSLQFPPLVTKESDDFWVVDADFNYRLPGRQGILSFGIKNLLDDSFRFQDVDPGNPRFAPERVLFGQVSLSFH